MSILSRDRPRRLDSQLEFVYFVISLVLPPLYYLAIFRQKSRYGVSTVVGVTALCGVTNALIWILIILVALLNRPLVGNNWEVLMTTFFIMAAVDIAVVVFAALSENKLQSGQWKIWVG